MARISVDDSFCKGCGLCVDACPEQIMALDRDKITVKATIRVLHRPGRVHGMHVLRGHVP